MSTQKGLAIHSPTIGGKDCRIDAQLSGGTSQVNPVLELPSGARKVLFNRSTVLPDPGAGEVYYDFI